MGPIDATQFYVDVNDTTCVNALVVFESTAEESALKAALAERFVECNPRMRSVLAKANVFGVPQLRILGTDRARALVDKMWRRHCEDGEEISHSELESEVAVLMGSRLRKDGEEQPLWEAHFWPFFRRDDHRQGSSSASAMLLRYHHGLADGITALRAVMLLATYDKEDVTSARPKTRARSHGGFGPLKLCTLAIDTVKAAVKVCLLPADPSSVLHPPALVPGAGAGVYCCSYHKSEFSVAHLKDISRSLSASHGHTPSINDLLLAALSGALRSSLLQDHSKLPLPQKFTSTVWVSLSPLSSMYKPADDPSCPHRLCNKDLGLVYVTLPLRDESAAARLAAIQKQTRALLTSPEPLVTNAVLKMLPVLPQWLFLPLATFLTKKTSISMSNVPGPQFPVSIGGTVVDQLCFFVAPQGCLSIFVCIMSYNDKVTVGIGADSNVLTAEQARLVVGPLFDNELAALADP